MIPITDQLRQSLDTFDSSHDKADPDKLNYLTPPIAAWAARVSLDGPVAYMEAEFFSGQGFQAAVVWHDRRVIFGPVVTSNEPDDEGKQPPWLPLDHWAIDRALRLLGVSAHGAGDEFDALGLGAHRSTEEWLPQSDSNSSHT